MANEPAPAVFSIVLRLIIVSPHTDLRPFAIAGGWSTESTHCASGGVSLTVRVLAARILSNSLKPAQQE